MRLDQSEEHEIFEEENHNIMVTQNQVKKVLYKETVLIDMYTCC